MPKTVAELRGELDAQLQQLARDRELLYAADGELKDLFLQNITVTDPETGASKTLATKDEVMEALMPHIGKPLMEVARPNGMRGLMRFFCYARGITMDEMESFAKEPDSAQAQAFRTHVAAIRQEFFDIVTSEDNARIGKMYADISRSIKYMDVSFMGRMDTVADMRANLFRAALFSGGQSAIVQNLNLGERFELPPEKQRNIDEIQAACEAEGENFEDLVGMMTMGGLTAQALSSTMHLDNEESLFNGLLTLHDRSVRIRESGARYLVDLGAAGDTIQMHNQHMFASEFTPARFENAAEAGENLLKAGELCMLLGEPDGLDITQTGDFVPFDMSQEDLIGYKELLQIFNVPQEEYIARIENKVKQNLPFTREETFRFLRYGAEGLPEKEKPLFDAALQGDYSQFDNLSPLSRNMLASQYAINHRAIFEHSDLQFANDLWALRERSARIGNNELMNPALRLAISLKMNEADTPEQKAHFRKLDELLNEQIMRDTLAPISQAEEAAVRAAAPDRADELLANGKKSQRVVGKLLLMAQLGQMTVKNGEHEGIWEGSVANAFAHCSRAVVSLPGGEKDQEAMMHSLLGDYKKEEPPVYKRSAATHSLNRSRREDGLQTEEKKTLGTLSNQYGMDVAVGGLGRLGLAGAQGQRTLLNDGSCGHMYMHVQEGDREHYGGMLIGFESDAPGKTGQTGHTHIGSKGEKASCFGGLRTDEIGNKYGGRTIDLRGLTTAQLWEVMTAYDNTLDDLEQAGTDASHLIHRLCGNVMTKDELQDFLSDLGMENEKVVSIVQSAMMTDLSLDDIADFAVLYNHAEEFEEIKDELMRDDYPERAEERAAKAHARMREQSQLDADIARAIDAMTDPRQKEVAEHLRDIQKEAARRSERLETEVGRLQTVAEECSRVKDPVIPLRLKSFALQRKRELERQKGPAITEQDAKDYLLQLCGKKEQTASLADMKSFADRNERMYLGKNFNQWELEWKRDNGIAATRDDDLDAFRRLRDRMDFSTRTFLGIRLSNSDQYQSILDAMETVDTLLEQPVSFMTCNQLATGYETLMQACQTYLDSHQSPKTQVGKERVQMVRDLMEMHADVEKEMDIFSFETVSALESSGKKWKEIDIGLGSPQREEISFDSLLKEEEKGKQRAIRERKEKVAQRTAQRTHTAQRPAPNRGNDRQM